MGSHLSAAIVRPPGDSFRLAVSLHEERELIDPDRARTQHAAFRNELGSLGVQLLELPPDELHPDSCFTQDPALVLEGRALIGRLGVESRAGEADAIAEALKPLVESIDRMAAPATFEGGDVMRIERKLLVGRSTRTNEEGIAALRRFAEPLGYTVHAVPVPRGVLHLSTAATYLGDGVVFGLGEVLSDPAFDGLERLVAKDTPLEACNLFVLHDHLVASGDYPVHDRLEERGYKVHRLELTEFVRADAGPTCLCLMLDGTSLAMTSGRHPAKLEGKERRR